MKFISKSSGVYEIKNYFSMNIVEEIFEIRICKEILANDVKIHINLSIHVLQLIMNYKVTYWGFFIPP